MCESAYKRYKRLLQQAQKDPEYRWLDRRRRELEPQAAQICNMCPGDVRDILTEYHGTCQEMAQRVIELACFMEEQKA